jgi:hypothetical protein
MIAAQAWVIAYRAARPADPASVPDAMGFLRTHQSGISESSVVAILLKYPRKA